MENKNYFWRPVSEYTGGRVLATNGLDVLIGEINSEGDCESEENGSTVLYGITGFIKIEEMLPELKESDGERIRKEIIQYIKTGTYHKSWIAWLEKQGEQKPFDYENANIQQKEPKFKVGDWIISNNKEYIYKIDKVQGWYYVVSDINNDEFNIGLEEAEKTGHLWTIQDAKDGDVLADSLGNVCIYQEPSTKLMYHSYCYGNHKCFIDMGGSHEIVGSYPATKEQRDLLFQKMKEAEYEWDADKKELKKIHVIDEGKAEMNYCFTKMMNSEKVSPTWNEEDENHIQHISDFIMRNRVGDTDAIYRLEQDVNWLKSLKERVIPQPKQEWSEEDEGVLLESISVLQNNSRWVLADKLKSLRPQKQWKPSEQEILLLERTFDGKLDPRDFQASLQNIIEQLKKLKG